MTRHLSEPEAWREVARRIAEDGLTEDGLNGLLAESPHDWRLWANLAAEVRLRSGRTVRPNDTTRASLVSYGLIEHSGNFVRLAAGRTDPEAGP